MDRKPRCNCPGCRTPPFQPTACDLYFAQLIKASAEYLLPTNHQLTPEEIHELLEKHKAEFLKMLENNLPHNHGASTSTQKKVVKEKAAVEENTRMVMKELAKLKKMEEESPMTSRNVKEEKKAKAQKPFPIPEVDLSTFFAYETTEKVETTRRCAKVVEKEEQTKKLWNGHMVLKTLKHLLPEKVYKKISVMLMHKFHGQLTQKYYTYQDILHMIQKFEWNNYHNHDKLLDDFQQLRSIPGSAMFFDSVGVLDYFIDEEKDEKVYDLKQNWLKRLAIKNCIQTKWNKDVLDIIIGYELDKVARGLGCCEVVKIEDYQKKFEEVYKEVEEQNDEGKKEEEEWMTTNKAQFDKMKDDKKLIEALIGFALNSEEYHTSHWLRNIIQHELETNEDRNDVIDHVLCDIHTARRTVAKLCKLDEYQLTKKWKKEEMKDIPMVRCIKLKEKIVFTSEVRYALEVAEQLNKFNMDMVDESLKMHGLTDNRVEVFEYVSVDELDDIATVNGLHQLPFELVHFEHPKLKTSHSYAPIISPNYTMCIPAFVVLEQVFNILSNELKIFYRLRRDSINELTRYIANLCYYLQPESQTTFCLDYKKVGELLDETRRLFNPLMDSSVEDLEDVDESIKPKEFKKILEKLAKKSVFRSFEIMLMVFADKAEKSHTNLSRNNLDECVYNAGCRCLMYEYPELAIAYHNQRMCQTTSKTQFCSICLIEDVEFRFITPSRCAVGYSQSMAEFQKKNDSGRMEKDVLEGSWIERMNKKVDMEMEAEKKKKKQEDEMGNEKKEKIVKLCPIDNVVFHGMAHKDDVFYMENRKKPRTKSHHEADYDRLHMKTTNRVRTESFMDNHEIKKYYEKKRIPKEDEMIMQKEEAKQFKYLAENGNVWMKRSCQRDEHEEWKACFPRANDTRNNLANGEGSSRSVYSPRNIRTNKPEVVKVEIQKIPNQSVLKKEQFEINNASKVDLKNQELQNKILEKKPCKIDDNDSMIKVENQHQNQNKSLENKPCCSTIKVENQQLLDHNMNSKKDQSEMELKV